MDDLIPVTPATATDVLARLPMTVRLTFSFAAKLRRGTLEARLPDGRRLRFGGAEPGPAAIMIVKDYSFGRRFVGGGDIGIAEAYLRGEWETPDLTQFLYLFCVNQDLIPTMLENRPLVRILQRLRHLMNRNTKHRAKRNIHAHYDIGNTFYESWLDETMTYSSALFTRGVDDLAAAQRYKYESLAAEIKLGPGQSVLEIGCGWGGFAEYAARTHGARIVGLTISREQFDYARKRIFAAGLADRVEIKLQDYRDEHGIYDRIASIEMIEAVGEEFWPAYFGQLSRRLVAGGIAGIQAITIQDRLFTGYRREIDFIRRYVFPGGMLPSPAILKGLGDRFGLALVAEKVFGDDYPRTLSAWRDRFRQAWPTLAPRIRRAVPAAVGVLPCLLRGRLFVAQYRRSPDDFCQRGVNRGTFFPRTCGDRRSPIGFFHKRHPGSRTTCKFAME
jgi:cyclopropane-fatty-acyl-phospholipid synthase